MSPYEALIEAGEVRVIDGWHVHAFYVPYFRMARQAPPRDFGMIDQLYFDLRRPGIEWGIWLVAAALVAAGVLSRSPIPTFAGGAVVAGMLRLAYRASRLWRHSPTVIHPFDDMADAVWAKTRGLPAGAMVATFDIDGRRVTAEIAADSLEHLHAEGHDRFEAFVLMPEFRNDAQCLALRGA